MCEKHAKGPKENGFCFSPPSFPSNCKHESRRAVAVELAVTVVVEQAVAVVVELAAAVVVGCLVAIWAQGSIWN